MSHRFMTAPATLLLFLVFALNAAPAAGEGSGKTDEGQPHLTPFDWKKTSPGAQESAPGGPRLKRQPEQDARNEDELVCEKGVVHPNKAPVGAPGLGATLGIQHCWKKSDPHTIIERPFGPLDFMSEAVQGAAQGGASAGFPPLKKPRIRASKMKPPEKRAAVVLSTATVLAPAPADKAAPQLLR